MGIALKAKAARWALTACAACLVSCSPTEKIRVYTAFSDVAFLNDTLAALIVVDATEKEAALGSAYIELLGPFPRATP